MFSIYICDCHLVRPVHPFFGCLTCASARKFECSDTCCVGFASLCQVSRHLSRILPLKLVILFAFYPVPLPGIRCSTDACHWRLDHSCFLSRIDFVSFGSQVPALTTACQDHFLLCKVQFWHEPAVHRDISRLIMERSKAVRQFSENW